MLVMGFEFLGSFSFLVGFSLQGIAAGRASYKNTREADRFLLQTSTRITSSTSTVVSTCLAPGNTDSCSQD